MPPPFTAPSLGMVTKADLELGEGRTLHVYDTGDAGARLAVFWHHGTPNIGAPPEPLFGAAEDPGIRWVSYDRPGYGGSTSAPGRNLASAVGIGSFRARTRLPLDGTGPVPGRRARLGPRTGRGGDGVAPEAGGPL
jgi:hypothetical protein